MRLIPVRYGFGSRFEVQPSRKNSFSGVEVLSAYVRESNLYAIYFTDDALDLDMGQVQGNCAVTGVVMR